MSFGLDLRAPHDSTRSALAAAIGAIALGHALQLANGAYTPDALFWVSVALAMALIATLAFQSSPRVAAAETALLVLVAGGGLIRQAWVHMTTAPGVYMRMGPDMSFVDHHRFVVAMTVAGGALLVADKGWARLIAVLLFLGSFLALAFWMVKASPAPIIDVYTWHNVAFDALKHGQNPWAIFMPNIYGHTMWYAPGLADATQVKVGYPYPPLLLFLGALGHVFANDYRYAQVMGLVLSGALLAFARPGRFGPLAATILFLSPRSLFVIEQGWTEPLALLMFCFVVFTACRWPKALPYALGLMVAVKQYYVILLPLAVLLVPGPFSWRELGKVMLRAGAVAVVLNLPFFLWDPGAFWRSLIEFQGKQPFRVEALSYVVATAENGQPRLPLWLPFPAAIPAIVLGCWRSPRSAQGFAAASSLAFILFFAFAKQAFCNYYFLIVGMLCCVMAAMGEPEPSGRPRTP